MSSQPNKLQRPHKWTRTSEAREPAWRARLTVVAAVFVVYIVITLLPLAWQTTVRATADLCVFILLSIMLFFADASRLWRSASVERVDPGGAYHSCALTGSLALLALQWTALLTLPTRASDISFLAGVLVAGLTGCGLRAMAVSQLADAFRSCDRPVRLVTEGIYRKVRHPSETGLLAIGTAFCLLGGTSIMSMVLMGILATTSAWRIRLEERHLNSKFAGFAAWRQKTGALLPAMMSWQHFARWRSR